MPLVSMKITKSDRDAKAYGGEASIAADAPEYPWSLCISLDDDALDKLGMSELPEVGTALNLTAIVRVTSVSMDETMGGEKRRRVGLQITDLALESAADMAGKLYT